MDEESIEQSAHSYVLMEVGIQPILQLSMC